jgi:excisionase family DNA binding protein
MPEFVTKPNASVEPCRQVKRRRMRTREAAEYLGISSWKLRQQAVDGAIPYSNTGDGSPWLFDLCDLDAYIERTKQVM